MVNTIQINMDQKNNDKPANKLKIYVGYNTVYHKVVNGLKEEFISDTTIFTKYITIHNNTVKSTIASALHISYRLLFKSVKEILEKQRFERKPFSLPKSLYIKIHLNRVYTYKSDNLCVEGEINSNDLQGIANKYVKLVEANLQRLITA